MCRSTSSVSERCPATLIALAIAFGATGCSLPRDTSGTLDRVRHGTTRVGVVTNPPWVSDSGASARGPAGKVKRAAERLPWVDRAAVRLREHRHAITGDVIVVPRADLKLTAEELAAQVESSAEEFCREDWRLHDLTVMPVLHLDSDEPPRVALSSPRSSR